LPQTRLCGPIPRLRLTGHSPIKIAGRSLAAILPYGVRTFLGWRYAKRGCPVCSARALYVNWRTVSGTILRQYAFASRITQRGHPAVSSMATAPLITLAGIRLAYGHHPLLDDADLAIQDNDRIGLIGRNGAGKSSLLRLLDGRAHADDGDMIQRSGIRIATVEQEPDIDDRVCILDAILGHADPHDDWSRPARVRAMIARLGLDPDQAVAELSGGMRKRVALLRGLAEDPDLLLLDEPTNHLDFDGIAWLENLLCGWNGTAVIITHDRRFLDVVATRIVELDRGRLLSFPGNFSDWQARKAQWLEAEQREHARFDKLLAQEEVWIRKGIEARRTRNEGRVRRLEQLRVLRSERRERVGTVSLNVAQGQRSGKLVAELEHVSKSFDGKVVIKDYSGTILRGDRIGLIGPNGVGKTTLLKIILGELSPDAGQVRLGTQLSVAYFDQMRAQLDDSATLADVISPGSEWVEIGSERKHIMSYLGDFLFPPARAGSPVSSLSGGERARLLLARLFARPANVLVLDEPTNDLDIETLELLEALLQDYPGTVLLVSHDRAFLNNVVTQTLAYEGHGRWRDYPGGYDDWLEQRPAPDTPTASRTPTARYPADSEENKPAPKPLPARPVRAARLTNWEQRELDALPETIAALEREQAELTQQLADGNLYRDAPDEVTRINNRIEEIETLLLEKLERWEQLETKAENE